MRLLLDQGLPRSTVGLLTAAEILAEATRRQAVVLSLDSDFHALLASSGDSGPSVIRICLEGLKASGLSALLLRVLGAIEAGLESGAVASVTEHQIRVHSLPIGRKRPK